MKKQLFFYTFCFYLISFHSKSQEIDETRNILNDTVFDKKDHQRVSTGDKTTAKDVSDSELLYFNGQYWKTIDPKEIDSLTVISPNLNSPKKKLKVGDSLFGGIVFYVDSTGQHGLLCSPEDFGMDLPWINQTSSFKDIGTKDEIYEGKANTKLIIDSQGFQNQIQLYAAMACLKITINGYDDWYLPSISELSLMYTNLHKKGIGNFKGYTYWSSSEDNFENFAWLIDFNTGSVEEYVKYHKATIRPIRQF